MAKNKKAYTAFAFATLLGVGGTAVFYPQNLNMKTYTVEQGGHFSFPRIFRLKRSPSKIEWQVKFHENCNYHLTENGHTHEDQYDWNKLCGVFFSLLNTRKDSAMMGWRYNPKTDEIEMAPYYHINGSRDMFPPMLTVKRKEPFTLSLSIDYRKKQYRWEMKKADSEAIHEIPFTHNGGLCGFINFYFGGNQTAPQTVSCEMSLTVGSL